MVKNIYYESRASAVDESIKSLIGQLVYNKRKLEQLRVRSQFLSPSESTEYLRIFANNMRDSLLLSSSVRIRVSRSSLLSYLTSRVDLKKANRIIEELVDNLLWTGNEIKRLNCLDAKSSGQSECRGCHIDWHSDTKAVLLPQFRVD